MGRNQWIEKEECSGWREREIKKSEVVAPVGAGREGEAGVHSSFQGAGSCPCLGAGMLRHLHTPGSFLSMEKVCPSREIPKRGLGRRVWENNRITVQDTESI
jgi:hypothetical protein